MRLQTRSGSTLQHVYGREVEIVSIKMKGIHALVTVKDTNTNNPFDQFTFKLLAKDELDAARQVLLASHKNGETQ
jgi:hypothetical protein